MTDTQKIAAGIFMFNSQGKPVVVSTRANENQYGIPGGKVDEGETAIQAAIREAYEETGVRVTEEQLYHCFEEPSRTFTMAIFVMNTPIETIPGGIETGITAKFGNFEDLAVNSPYAEFNKRMLKAIAEHQDTHPYLRHTLEGYQDSEKNHYDLTAFMDPRTVEKRQKLKV